MEAVQWETAQYKHASLPKLRMAEEVSRRDSITSSRTGDSGYISDADVSHSPLDFVSRDKHAYDVRHSKAPVAVAIDSPMHVDVEPDFYTKSIAASRGTFHSIIKKRFKEDLEVPLFRPQVTSNPTLLTGATTSQKADWTHAFKCPPDFATCKALNEPDEGLDKLLLRKDNIQLWIDEHMPSLNRPKERVSSIASISSTGSGSNYTATDDSEMDDAERLGSNNLSKATMKTIQLILRKIEVNLRYAAYKQCAGGQSYRSNAGPGETTRGVRGANQSSSGKRKLQPDDCPSEHADDDGTDKRRRVSITTTEDSEAGPRFACPFYKHDPNRYRNRRTCPGPGWPTVHRMKEHLYRSHAQPICCPRCYSMFDSDSDLSLHLRQTPCQIAQPQPIEGINRETLQNLRRRSPALRLEEDKWRDTYKLLFPDVPEADIPSPYYNNDSPTEESRRFRRMLMERIRTELFATAERSSDLAEQTLLREVAGIIYRCESELLNSFYATPALTRSGTMGATPTTLSSTHQSPPQQSSLLVETRTSASAIDASMGLLPPSSTSLELARPTSVLAAVEPTSSAETHYLTEPLMQYTSVWEDPFQATSNQWIDWNAVFPPVPETSVAVERNEPAPLLSTPVWS